MSGKESAFSDFDLNLNIYLFILTWHLSKQRLVFHWDSQDLSHTVDSQSQCKGSPILFRLISVASNS